MNHVVLLGDSIFDNGIYVARNESVIDHAMGLWPREWKRTLLAVDGSTAVGVSRQLARLPEDATYLVVSTGGNDALGHFDILSAPAHSSAQIIGELATISENFEARYTQMLAEVLQLQRPTVVCTIYYPRFPDPVVQRLAVTASAIFNDIILRRAFSVGVPVIDLRMVCNEDADYANPIEPSSSGGRKIVEAIRRVITTHDFTRKRTEVFV